MSPPAFMRRSLLLLIIAAVVVGIVAVRNVSFLRGQSSSSGGPYMIGHNGAWGSAVCDAGTTCFVSTDRFQVSCMAGANVDFIKEYFRYQQCSDGSYSQYCMDGNNATELCGVYDKFDTSDARYCTTSYGMDMGGGGGDGIYDNRNFCSMQNVEQHGLGYYQANQIAPQAGNSSACTYLNSTGWTQAILEWSCSEMSCQEFCFYNCQDCRGEYPNDTPEFRVQKCATLCALPKCSEVSSVCRTAGQSCGASTQCQSHNDRSYDLTTLQGNGFYGVDATFEWYKKILNQPDGKYNGSDTIAFGTVTTACCNGSCTSGACPGSAVSSSSSSSSSSTSSSVAASAVSSAACGDGKFESPEACDGGQDCCTGPVNACASACTCPANLVPDGSGGCKCPTFAPYRNSQHQAFDARCYVCLDTSHCASAGACKARCDTTTLTHSCVSPCTDPEASHCKANGNSFTCEACPNANQEYCGLSGDDEAVCCASGRCMYSFDEDCVKACYDSYKKAYNLCAVNAKTKAELDTCQTAAKGKYEECQEICKEQGTARCARSFSSGQPNPDGCNITFQPQCLCDTLPGCAAEFCKGNIFICEDGNQCTQDYCNSGNGQCVNQPWIVPIQGCTQGGIGASGGGSNGSAQTSAGGSNTSQVGSAGSTGTSSAGSSPGTGSATSGSTGVSSTALSSGQSSAVASSLSSSQIIAIFSSSAIASGGQSSVSLSSSDSSVFSSSGFSSATITSLSSSAATSFFSSLSSAGLRSSNSRSWGGFDFSFGFSTSGDADGSSETGIFSADSSAGTVVSSIFSSSGQPQSSPFVIVQLSTSSLQNCGNGMPDSGEECDDGNTVDGDGCSAVCRSEFVLIVQSTSSSVVSQRSQILVAAASLCGNGLLESPEECDDSNRRSGDGCNDSCLLEIGICGDGKVQQLLGEQCESSLHDPSLLYGCRNCRFFSTSCGDGKTDPGEECDKGNLNSTSPNADCRPDCSLSRCGDGILDSAEICDDGNRRSGDGCDSYCRKETSLVASDKTQESKNQKPDTNNSITNNPFTVPFPYTQPQPYPSYQLPFASLQPLIQQMPQTTQSGPAAVVAIGAGAAAGLSWVRRRK